MSATRRKILAGTTSSLAAAVLASAAALPAIDPDAELLALRPAWDRTWADLQAGLKAFNAAEISGDRQRITAAKEAVSTAQDANADITDQIATLPARTIAGLRFKAEASIGEDHPHEELIASIMDDIAALPA